MPRKPKYGYRRDIFGRVQESDSFKDGAYSNVDYGQSSYDPEDDNGDWQSKIPYIVVNTVDLFPTL